MSEYPCSLWDVPFDLGCDNLQLFEGVIDSEVPKQSPDIRGGDAVHWKTEDTYDLIYEVPRTIDESLLPGNRNMSSEKKVDVHTRTVENWTTENILDWICKEYSRNNRDYENLPLPKFRTITVNEFRNMQIDDFLKKIDSIEEAEFLYNCKERLFASCKRKKVEDWSDTDLMEWICKMYDQHNINYENVALRNFKNVTIQNFKKMTDADLYELLGNWDDANFLYSCKNDLFGCSLYSSQAVYVPSYHQVNSSPEVNNNEMYGFYNKPIPVGNTQIRKDNHIINGNNPEHVRIRKRGRPRTKEVQSVKKERRTGKLWEFLRNLLMDETTCPSLIKWENYEERMFKFVQNEKVAKLWGDRKKNGKMNYEKFSRAMRYYYRNKILQPVSGKRLVYKFGPNATGFREKKPIL